MYLRVGDRRREAGAEHPAGDRQLGQHTLLRALLDGSGPGARCVADAPGLLTVPELQAAVECGASSLDLVIAARRATQPRYNPDPASRIEALRWSARLERQHQDRGQWLDSYFARYIEAAVLLVRNKEESSESDQLILRLRYPPEAVACLSPRFEHAIWTCTSLARHSHSPNISALDRDESVRKLYSLAVYLLGVLDAQNAPPSKGASAGDAKSHQQRIDQALEAAEAELSRIQRYLTDAGRRQALRWFMLALLLGAVLFGVAYVAGLFAFLVGLRGRLPAGEEALLEVATAAGGAGALVSVMWRITNGDFSVDDRAGKLSVWLSGLFRPILGLMFGAALFALVQSGILPALQPEPGPGKPYYFAILGFLAGFSERFAPDLFHTASRGLAPADTQPAGRRRSKQTVTAPARS